MEKLKKIVDGLNRVKKTIYEHSSETKEDVISYYKLLSDLVKGTSLDNEQTKTILEKILFTSNSIEIYDLCCKLLESVLKEIGSYKPMEFNVNNFIGGAGYDKKYYKNGFVFVTNNSSAVRLKVDYKENLEGKCVDVNDKVSHLMVNFVYYDYKNIFEISKGKKFSLNKKVLSEYVEDYYYKKTANDDIFLSMIELTKGINNKCIDFKNAQLLLSFMENFGVDDVVFEIGNGKIPDRLLCLSDENVFACVLNDKKKLSVKDDMYFYELPLE